jgi:hypothetical protein
VHAIHPQPDLTWPGPDQTASVRRRSLKLHFKDRRPAFKAQAGLFGPVKLEEGAAGDGLPGGYWLQRLDD